MQIRMKVWLYAAPNSAEFVHDLRYSQTWEYEWISKVFCGDKKLGYVGVSNFGNADFLQVRNTPIELKNSIGCP